MKLTVGTRMEETERAAQCLEQTIVEALGTQVVRTVVTYAGIPTGRSALFSANTGPHAANVQVNLVQASPREQSDVQLMDKVRKLAYDGRFAGIHVYFFSGGIVKRILNFGADARSGGEVPGYDL